MRSLELPFGFPLFPVPDMQATAAGHRLASAVGTFPQFCFPAIRDARQKQRCQYETAAVRKRIYVTRSDAEGQISYGCSESRRRYGENPGEVRGGRKPGVSHVAIGVFTARKILLMAVVPAGNPPPPARPPGPGAHGRVWFRQVVEAGVPGSFLPAGGAASRPEVSRGQQA